MAISFKRIARQVNRPPNAIIKSYLRRFQDPCPALSCLTLQRPFYNATICLSIFLRFWRLCIPSISLRDGYFCELLGGIAVANVVTRWQCSIRMFRRCAPLQNISAPCTVCYKHTFLMTCNYMHTLLCNYVNIEYKHTQAALLGQLVLV